MKELDGRLRCGMTVNGIHPKVQDEIIHSISSFALYGFPESHAASFALIAYASAYIKCNYLAAFTAALLNNQPMGFYSPATIVKDAQRHGLRVKPVDVQHSDWPCTLEPEPGNPHRFALRLGLCYAHGLRQDTALALIAARAQHAFPSIQDLAMRVPELRKSDLALLAQIGALNSLGEVAHRRDALWQVEYAGRLAGPLLNELPEQTTGSSPLLQMTIEERLVADFSGTGVTVGKHPMAFHRAELKQIGILAACELARLANGRTVCIAGCVIARQRPGTAKGFVFLSIEDETGIANAIITPAVYEQFRQVVIYEKFVMIEGTLQNQENVISVKAKTIRPLEITKAEVRSHDFH
jgi:error-prone DNA polymerase